MPVSEATARKAVLAWDLNGEVEVLECGCRFWHPRSILRPVRQVYTCVNHSPGWNQRDADT